MKTQNYVVLAVIVPILVFALVLTAITGGPAATAAPAAAPTPVSVSAGSNTPDLFTAYTEEAIAADEQQLFFDQIRDHLATSHVIQNGLRLGVGER